MEDLAATLNPMHLLLVIVIATLAGGLAWEGIKRYGRARGRFAFGTWEEHDADRGIDRRGPSRVCIEPAEGEHLEALRQAFAHAPPPHLRIVEGGRARMVMRQLEAERERADIAIRLLNLRQRQQFDTEWTAAVMRAAIRHRDHAPLGPT